MKRRNFFRTAILAGLGLSAGPASGVERDTGGEIDPYFLDTGELTEAEQQAVEEYVGYRDSLLEGREAVMPRGGKPKRAPTYRFLHWHGELGDGNGRLSRRPSCGSGRPQRPAFRPGSLKNRITRWAIRGRRLPCSSLQLNVRPPSRCTTGWKSWLSRCGRWMRRSSERQCSMPGGRWMTGSVSYLINC